MHPAVHGSLRSLVGAVLITASVAGASSSAGAAEPSAVIDARHLGLSMPHGFALARDRQASPPPPAAPSSAPVPSSSAARFAVPGTWRSATSGFRAGGLPNFLEGLPLAFDGADVVFAPGALSVRVGTGATASRDAARADLSRMSWLTSARLAAAGGDAEFRDTPGAASVGDVFDRFDGLGSGRRLRVDVDARDDSTLGFSITPAHDLDLAFASRGDWRGLDTDARAAVVLDNAPAGRAVRFEGSAALRDGRSGWNLAVAATTGGRAGDDGTPTTLYAKIARRAESQAAEATAWSLDAAWARDVARAGERAWLLGATVVQRWRGGRLHLRYRWQALDGTAERRGGAHAVVMGARIRL